MSINMGFGLSSSEPLAQQFDRRQATPVDAVGVEERAASFAKRSIKKSSKLWALDLAIRTMDLTTLAGADTPGKVRQLCGKARRPVPESLSPVLENGETVVEIPPVAAVCVYPTMVPWAVKALRGSAIEVASVATAFPSGQLPLPLKLQEVHDVVSQGATEVDMVIRRGDFLAGEYNKVFDEIAQIKDACGTAHLKVILETGELQTYDNVAKASWLAMNAGADFIKTSTGKVSPAATMPVTLVMLQTIADFYNQTGRKVGMKPAGGIRTAKQAIHYLCMVNEVVGPEWLTPSLWRFGASSLLNDVLKQIFKQKTGHYYYEKIFSLD